MAARSKQEASPRTCASECECELEARLDEIERRLSALEGASAETIADLAWQAAAPSPADQTRAVEDRLARLLEVLATHRRATAAAKALGDSHGAGAETRRFAMECLDPVWDRLRVAAAAVAEMPATSAADVRAKAEAIEVLCEESSEDIVHRLAASLARDVLTNVQPVS